MIFSFILPLQAKLVFIRLAYCVNCNLISLQQQQEVLKQQLCMMTQYSNTSQRFFFNLIDF
jgi:hypothetical protein